jgi:hypothetical protein
MRTNRIDPANRIRQQAAERNAGLPASASEPNERKAGRLVSASGPSAGRLLRSERAFGKPERNAAMPPPYS